MASEDVSALLSASVQPSLGASKPRRFRQCAACNRLLRRLDLHLKGHHRMAHSDAAVLLSAERKRHREAIRVARAVTWPPSEVSRPAPAPPPLCDHSSSDDEDDDDANEHDLSLMTMLSQTCIDSSAQIFVADLHRWMTSVDCGLSQATADTYARHSARFLEAVGGTVSALQSYADLTARGGYVERLRRANQPSTVRCALWSLKRTFSYVRLANTGHFTSEFCRVAEERIANWAISLKADASRQCHLHRESEDDIVNGIIRLLPHFSGLSAVRDALRLLLGVSTAACLVTLSTSWSDFRAMRDYLLVELALSNGHRSGAILSMTMHEFDHSSVVSDHWVIRVASHKTSSTYGSALVVVCAATHGHMQTFVTVRSGNVPDSSACFFCSSNGSRLSASHLTERLTEAFRRDGLVVRDRHGEAQTITATRLRKAHVACARLSDRTSTEMYDMSRHMAHRVTTQQLSYDVAERDVQSVLVYSRIMRDSFESRPRNQQTAQHQRGEELEHAQLTEPRDVATEDLPEQSDLARQVATTVVSVEPVPPQRRVKRSRRAGFTAEDVTFLCRTYPRRGPVYARNVLADAEFNPELQSLLARFTVKQVTDRIRALHRP